MKIAYISNSRIPTEKANGVQIVKTCEALTRSGQEVRLIIPKREQIAQFKNIDTFKYYGVKNQFSIICLPTVDLLTTVNKLPHTINIMAYFLEEVTFLVSLAGQNIFEKAIYTRSITAALVCKLLKGKKTVYEVHNITTNNFFKKIHAFFWERLDGVVAISRGLEAEVNKNSSVPTAVIPDAVEIAAYQSLNKSQARKSLKISEKVRLVVYCGSLAERKGVFTLAQAAQKLRKERNWQFLFVGGTLSGGDDEKLKKMVQTNNLVNVKFAGLVAPTKVPAYLQAADVLVLPDSAKFKVSREYTSPMKLFEYLAAGRVIVASETPANKEVLTDRKNAIFFKPDDANDLAEKISLALSNHRLSEKIRSQAKQDANKYSWEERVKKIVGFLNSL
jgi:glycosyltransferase involved in cell wall biosynthesis